MPRSNLWPELMLRVLTVPLFLVAGLGHIVRPDEFVDRLEKAPLGGHIAKMADPGLLVLATGIVLVIGGVMLLVGFRTRIAAVALIAVLVPITLSTHLGSVHSVGPLLKNVVVLGSLLYFSVVGARVFAIDALGTDRAVSSA